MGTDHIESDQLAVLLICHGTVERVEEIPAFVQNIRRGHPAPPEVVAEVQRRFERIGGSPLMRITHAQAEALEERLGIAVRAAARLWHPYPGEVIAALAAERPRLSALVCVPLAPQSVHVYNDAVAQEAARHGLHFAGAPSWGSEPKLIAAFADAIAERHAAMASREQLCILLTAHSLPQRAIDAGDPYERDFRQMAARVADAIIARGLATQDAVRVAFQSQGLGGGDWLGPDLETALAEARRDGYERALIAPIGFLAEHVETLYDIDIEAAALARQLGFDELARMPPMNTRPGFIDALEAVARPLLA